MKAYFLLCLSFISSLVIYSQDIVQWCNVRELNSGKKPIANVQIIFTDAPPAVSDQNGKLRLVFKGKKTGNYVFLVGIQKEGYELVNSKELEQVKISKDDQLPVDIILAKVGIIEYTKKKYYSIADKELKASFERERIKLRNELVAAGLSADQYEKKFKQLTKEYESQQNDLEGLADKFARVNFDDVSPVYVEALEDFKAGKIKEAIVKLENVNYAKIKVVTVQEELLITKLELDSLRAVLEKQKLRRIEIIHLLANMYALTYDFVKSIDLYEQILKIDSSDVKTLIEYSNLLVNQNYTNKSINLLERALKLQNKNYSYVYDNVRIYNQLGTLYATINNNGSSKNYFLLADICLDSIFKKNLRTINKAQYPSLDGIKDHFIKKATISNNMGILFEKQKQYDSAAFHFKKSLKTLSELDTNSSKVRVILADTYLSIGILLIDFIGDNKSAFNDSYNYLIQAHEIYSGVNEFSEELLKMESVRLNTLGHLFERVGQIEKAENYYLQSLKITLDMYKSIPNIYRTDATRSYLILALFYWKIYESDNARINIKNKSLEYFSLANKILEPEIYKDDLTIAFKELISIYLNDK